MKGREERYAKTFSPSLLESRVFLQDRLSGYEMIAVKYRNTKDAEERRYLKFLNVEYRKLEKKLFPNRLVRLLRSIVKALTVPMAVSKEIKQSLNNQKQILDQLQGAGLGQIRSQVEKYMLQGEPKFTVPINLIMSQNDQISYGLSYVRDDVGQYHPISLKAILREEKNPNKTIVQNFSTDAGEMPNARQAYNLMKGGAILKVEDGGVRTWLVLDFNDKDAQGSCKLKQLHYDYNLHNVLADLRIKELKSPLLMEHLIKGLENGERMQVTVTKGGRAEKLFIQADPARKDVLIYDANMNQINKETALGIAERKNTVKLEVVKKMEEAPIKKKGMSIHK